MLNLKEQHQHGGGIDLKFAGNFYNGYFDANNTKFNTLVLKYRHRESGGTWSDWTNLVLNTDYSYGTGNTYNSSSINLGTEFDYKKKYEFQLSYADQLSSAVFTQTVKEGEPVYDFGKDKDEENYFWINGNIFIKKIKVYTGSCNNINYNSTLWISNGTDCPPQLNGINFGFLTTKIINDNYIEQELADANSNNRFTRSKIDGAWSSWTKLAIQTDLDSINGAITNVEVPALTVQTDTTEHVLKSFTVTKAGRYMFLADVPINYYGATGRILYLRLKVNGVEKFVGGGIINVSAYTLYTKLLAVVDVPDNANVSVSIQNNLANAQFACGAFGLQYFRLK